MRGLFSGTYYIVIQKVMEPFNPFFKSKLRYMLNESQSILEVIMNSYGKNYIIQNVNICI